MSETTGVSITLRDMKKVYLPGETVEGVLSWNLIEQPKKVSVSLVWKTQGKGISDTEVAGSTDTGGPAMLAGTLPFSFVIPLEPYSFSGQLVSIIWAVEAKAHKMDFEDRVEIVVSPTGKEIRPTGVAADALVG